MSIPFRARPIKGAGARSALHQAGIHIPHVPADGRRPNDDLREVLQSLTGLVIEYPESLYDDAVIRTSPDPDDRPSFVRLGWDHEFPWRALLNSDSPMLVVHVVEGLAWACGAQELNSLRDGSSLVLAPGVDTAALKTKWVAEIQAIHGHCPDGKTVMRAVPGPVRVAIEMLRSELRAEWDKPRLCRLIQAILNSFAGTACHRRLAWLALFCARRALPCWQLYCDGDEPRQAVGAVRRWLAGEGPKEACAACSREATPAYHGVRITDCRECDTSCAAAAAAAAARFVTSREPDDVLECLEMADAAFSQSPLSRPDRFRIWLLYYAIPAAMADRDLQPAEQEAYRDYDSSGIPLDREREHRW